MFTSLAVARKELSAWRTPTILSGQSQARARDSETEMKFPIFIDAEEYEAHVEEYDGLCLSCGEWSFGGCEGDAENYECEFCGNHKVTGAENALLCGYISISN